MKKVLLAMMIMIVVLAIAGCAAESQAPQDGGTSEGAETETTEPVEEPEPESEPAESESAEFNIADGLRMTEEGPEKTIDTTWFTLKLGAGDTWIYEIDDERSISLYNIISRDSNAGGWLCSIKAYDEGDTSYEELQSYAKAGAAGGKTIVVEYPTDLQYDPNNAQASEEYKVVLQQLQKIRDGGGESPLQLK